MKWNKKSVRKRMQQIGMAGICMIGVTGCMMSKREIDQKAVEMFKEKYGVDCEVIYTDIIDDSIENRDEVHVYVEEYMEEGETAIIYSRMKDGKVVASDDLFGFIIREDYEDAVREVAEQEFEHVKVFVDYVGASFDNALTAESTLEDAYAAGEKVTTRIKIMVLPEHEKEEFDRKGELVCAELKKAQLNGRVQFYEVSEEIFHQVTRVDSDEKVRRDVDGINVFKFYTGKSW